MGKARSPGEGKRGRDDDGGVVTRSRGKPADAAREGDPGGAAGPLGKRGRREEAGGAGPGKCSRVNFAAHGPYHPVVHMPSKFYLHDFSKDKDPQPDGTWSVGKYDEVRPTMYDTPMYSDRDKAIQGFAGVRDVHVGLDIGGPVGTPVHAWREGRVLHAGHNPAAGDYGYVLVTEHDVGGVPVYSLYGHLGRGALALSPPGRRVAAGDVLGHLGGRDENGGWPPHVHFQLSLARPETHDLPGVVSRADRARALEKYPDPRLVLGMLYR